MIRISQEKGKTVFILFILIGIFTFFAHFSWAQGKIEVIKLKPEQMPGEWKLANEYIAPKQKIQQFEAKFIASIDEILNQMFMVNGQTEVKINYVDSPSENNTATVYQKMIELVGMENVIVKKENVVIEIISSNNGFKEKVVKLLQLPPLQKFKLNVTNIPDEWRLVDEFFIFGSEFKQFEERFGASFEEIINQLFFADNHKLQINYISCVTEQDAKIAYKKIESLTGEKNLMLLIKDTIIIEIISESDSLKEQAKNLLTRM